MKEIKVLDKGYVKYIRHMGDDLAPVEDARMSTNNPTGVDAKRDDGLRNYLWENEHTSPFESCVLTLEFKIPLIILNQADRHRTFDMTGFEVTDYSDFRKYTARNGFSGRYSEFEDEIYVPEVERMRKQDPYNKQASGEPLNEEEARAAVEIFNLSVYEAFSNYVALINRGIAREVARMVLPQCIYTKMRITANLLNWFKALRLRLDDHAQEEIRDYFKGAADIIKELWPKSWDAFEEHTLYGLKLSRSEAKALITVLNIYQTWGDGILPQIGTPSATFKAELGDKGFNKLMNKFLKVK